MLIISHDELNKIKQHAIDMYPLECCGVLLGKFTQNAKIANKAINLQNSEISTKLENSFKINSEAVLKIDNIAQKLDLDIVGFYHSHPDCDATISKCDILNSFPIISNLILSVKNKQIIEMASWRILADKSPKKETLKYTQEISNV